MRAVVIGSGLGGLETGILLSREGYDVTILEQQARIGGCIQSFSRKGYVFDTGLHLVGGLEEGSAFREAALGIGLMDLEWVPMEGEEVVIGGDCFFLPAGYDAFKEALKAYFPESEDDIDRYCATISSVNGKFTEWMGKSAYRFLCDTISDPLLRKVLSGTSLKMELDAERLPLYTFARINDSFIRSSWRLKGCGSDLALALASRILNAGGKIFTGEKVRSIDSEEGKVVSVTSETGRVFKADIVVSSIHPSLTMELAGESLRKIYRTRISSLKNTKGFFTANIALRKDLHLRRNIYVHTPEADLWRPSEDVLESVMVSFPESETPSLDILTRTLPSGNTASERMALAERCIELVSERLPELKGSIEHIYTSTPSTYERFTSTPNGSAYGAAKDWRSPETTVIQPRTPLKGLFLTGQSLALHGVYGVTMAAMGTMEEIKKQSII